jgi:ubiquinone/menaquinone biosynthesis C-methylase UbiE
MTQGFPFETQSVDVMVSDLSLHYFDLQTTEKILKEINRVLHLNGMLLARVNSIGEYIPQQNDIQLENNYYFSKGYYRRYFSIEDINKIFGSVFSVGNISEYTSNKYSETKSLIEFTAMKFT